LFLIAGLGNPGAAYEGTRHNVGFMLVDRLAKAWGIRLKASGGSVWGRGGSAGVEVVLLKPQTFMNLSGGAVSGLARSYSVPPEAVVVCYDDCDLPLGRLRLRGSGGSGGHRGLASVIERLGTADFPRLRLGIGRDARADLKDYVLAEFTAGEAGAIDAMLADAVSCMDTFIKDGIEAAMNRFNAPG
jgi:PTH1 family peptidyl-tRNA hydrolase